MYIFLYNNYFGDHRYTCMRRSELLTSGITTCITTSLDGDLIEHREGGLEPTDDTEVMLWKLYGTTIQLMHTASGA